MADYSTIAKKFDASEDRLVALLNELQQIRNAAKSVNFSNPEHARRAEEIFAAGVKEQHAAQALLDTLTERHKAHFQREYEKQLDEARQALLPLARAWRISHRAFGASGSFAVWLHGRLPGLLSEAETATAADVHELPLDPPRSYALDLADDQLRC